MTQESPISSEFAREDNCLGLMVPSDLGVLVAERDRLLEENLALKSEKEPGISNLHTEYLGNGSTIRYSEGMYYLYKMGKRIDSFYPGQMRYLKKFIKRMNKYEKRNTD